MKRAAIWLSALLVSVGIVTVGYAQNGVLPNFDPSCTPLVHLISQNYSPGTLYNTQGLEPEYPIWCYPQPQAGAATAVRTANSWVDSWDNGGPSVQTLNDGDYDYRVFERLARNPGDPRGNTKFKCFINTDHWMCDGVDTSTDRLSGGILVSPDQTFSAINGALVVEADAAQGAPGMGGADHYYELDVTNGTAPTEYTVDGLYGYGQFGFIGAVGCRLENPAIVCAMYDDSGRATDGRCTGTTNNPSVVRQCTNGTGGFSGRVWETQGVGTALTGANVQGGYQDWVIPGGGGLRVRDVMRTCPNNVHDFHCRDRFRMELTRTSLHLYANGYPVLLIDGLTARNSEGQDARIPQAFLDQGRFYMTSWINSGQHTPLRWHWNQVAVNPPYPLSESKSISWCQGTTVMNPNGTQSPNTCGHAHVQSCPENQPIGTTCTQTPTPVPTSVPPTGTPEPSQTSTPTSEPTQVPTSTPEAIPTSTPEPTHTPGCIISAIQDGSVKWFVDAPLSACD